MNIGSGEVDRSRCPVCDERITAVTTLGPSTHYVSSCGHAVGPMTVRVLAGDR